jgi:hypothetical protein
MAIALHSSGTLRVRDPDVRARLAALTPVVAPGALAAERHLEVHPALEALLPQGLARGTSVACQGPAAATTALLLAARTTQQGSWLGGAGWDTFGPDAAREAGVVLDRVVMVRRPSDGSGGDEWWGHVLAGLVDGFDVVVVGDATAVRPSTARRVQARLQSRGGVLVLVGDPGGFAPELRITGTSRWHGLADGHGHLAARRLELTAEGRRMPRARVHHVWCPGLDGRITSAVPSVNPMAVPTTPMAPALERTG